MRPGDHLSYVVPDVWQQGIIRHGQALFKAAEAQVVLPSVKAAEPQVGPHLCTGLTHLRGTAHAAQDTRLYICRPCNTPACTAGRLVRSGDGADLEA